MKYPSFKKLYIYALSSACEEGAHLQGNEIIILTSSAIIKGIPIGIKEYPEDDLNDYDVNKDLLNHYRALTSKTLKEEYENEGIIEGNDGCIILKNATAQYAPNFTCNFQQVTIFLDQILGITLGSGDIERY